MSKSSCQIFHWHQTAFVDDSQTTLLEEFLTLGKAKYLPSEKADLEGRSFPRKKKRAPKHSVSAHTHLFLPPGSKRLWLHTYKSIPVQGLPVGIPSTTAER